MIFKIKQVFSLLSTDSGSKIFCDVYGYSGATDISGIFFTVAGDDFNKTESGAGSYTWTEYPCDFYLRLSHTYRLLPTVTRGQMWYDRGAGSNATLEMLYDYGSGRDLSTCTHFHVANGDDINTTGWYLRLETDSSNYYTYTIPVGSWDANITVNIALADFTSSGSPSWSNIRYIRIIPVTTAPATMYIGTIWFTKSWLFCLETTSATPVDLDSGELDVSLTKGEDLSIKYYVGFGVNGAGTITLSNPASKVYNVGYPEDYVP
jgi:hypothetical protein